MRRVFAVVDDLFFLAKIRDAAQQTGIPFYPLDPGQVEQRLAGAKDVAIVLDLNHRTGRAVDVIRSVKGNPETAKIPVLGFVSHVQGDVIHSARSAGCDHVVARSRFSRELPRLLLEIAGETEGGVC